MRVLAIDTCLAACSVAVLDGERPVVSTSEPMDRGHQERLAPLAQEVMARAGLAFAELDRIAVTLGPGSFTGLRVGLAFAKGLGLALDRPVIGLGCLEVLAAPFAGSPGRTLVLLPGRGEAICHQVFEGGVALGPPILGPEADLEALAVPDAAVAAQMAVLRQPGPLIPLYMRPPDARLPGGRLPE